MNPNHIDLPGTPIELEGEIIGYVENTNKVMSEVNPNYNPQDPFGNRWEKHPSAVENQIKEDSPWDVPTTNGKPNYDPSTGEKNPYLGEEETIKYGLQLPKSLRKSILTFMLAIWLSWKSSWSYLAVNILTTACITLLLALALLLKMKGNSLLQAYGIE
jgi:hypothetical protein